MAFPYNSCACDPRCNGPFDPIHNDMRARANAYPPGFDDGFFNDPTSRDFYPSIDPFGYPYMGDMGDLYTQQPINQRVPPPQPIEMREGTEGMLDALDDVLEHIAMYPSTIPGLSLEHDAAIATLQDARASFESGTLVVPPHIASASNGSLRYAAAIQWIADRLLTAWVGFASVPPIVANIIDELLELAQDIRVAHDLGQAAQGSAQNAATASAEDTAAATSADEQPKRPGPGVLQSNENDDLRTATTLPTANRLMVIGSGTDAIDYFDVRRLGMHGVNAIKVMHSLRADDVAELQMHMLHQLFTSLARKAADCRGPRNRAIVSSMEQIRIALARRGIDMLDPQQLISMMRTAPGMPRGTSQSFRGASQMPGVPPFGPWPSAARRASSYGGMRGASRNAQRKESMRSGSMGGPLFGSMAYSGIPRNPITDGFLNVAQEVRSRQSSIGGMRQPSFGGMRQPSFGGMRQPSSGWARLATPSFYLGATKPSSQAGRSASTMPGSFPTQESVTLPKRTGLQDDTELGNGQVFDERGFLPDNTEIQLHHPVELSDLSDKGIDDRTLFELAEFLVAKNSSVTVDSLDKPDLAARYQARKESIAALKGHLEARKDAKVEAASSAEGGAAAPGNSSSPNENAAASTAHLQVPGSKQPAAPRSVSFHAHEKNAPEGTATRPGLGGSRQSSRLSVYRERFGRRSGGSSRASSFAGQAQPRTPIAAFPNADRVRTLQAQAHAEEAQQMLRRQVMNSAGSAAVDASFLKKWADVEGNETTGGLDDLAKLEAELAQLETTDESTCTKTDKGKGKMTENAPVTVAAENAQTGSLPSNSAQPSSQNAPAAVSVDDVSDAAEAGSDTGEKLEEARKDDDLGGMLPGSNGATGESSG